MSPSTEKTTTTLWDSITSDQKIQKQNQTTTRMKVTIWTHLANEEKAEKAKAKGTATTVAEVDTLQHFAQQLREVQTKDCVTVARAPDT